VNPNTGNLSVANITLNLIDLIILYY
jgi:hypothetical protein